MTGKRQGNRRKGLRLATLCVTAVMVTATLTTAWASPGGHPSGKKTETAPVNTEATDSGAEMIPLPAEKREELGRVQMPEVPVAAAVSPAAAPGVKPVEDTYFADAVFLGDSRTEGFSLYSGLKKGTFLFAVGATVESVFTKATPRAGGGKAPLLDTLAKTDCGKIYVMLGLNELGWVHAETYQKQYGKVIDRIRADHPDATVVVQSLPPVSAGQDAKKTYVNNARIRVYNDLLEKLAAEKDCVYLDVASAVTGADGCLPDAMTFDGVHLNPAGCKAWLDYLRGRPV
ncbi:MAG: GDSL-type esterase/lipase family protein [Oscillibacter sp.]